MAFGRECLRVAGAFCVDRLIARCLAVAGALLAAFGLYWLWTGYDIIQVERGWASVIAGATMLSGGVVTLALAAILMRLQAPADAGLAGTHASPIDTPVAAPAVAAPPLVSTPATPMPERIPIPPTPPVAHPATESAPFVPLETPAPVASSVDASRAASEVIERHVAGDTTYVMFADGSVEAQTPDGTVRFDSLDALRLYADERAASASVTPSPRT